MAKQAFKILTKHVKNGIEYEVFEFPKFKNSELEKINFINKVIDEYLEKKYTLTVRQLYYQLVARAYIQNNKKEYDNMSRFLSKARYGGLVDWDAIEDRNRVPHVATSYATISDKLLSAWYNFEVDRQGFQKNHVEVWCEKDALTGILERVTQEYHIPLVVNRGFSSTTAMFQAKQRFEKATEQGQNCVLLYLGDHDPSGLKMIKSDIPKRLSQLMPEVEIKINPIALTYDQIKKYAPPAYPAKLKDPNIKWYTTSYGCEAWEVDALRPEVLESLVRESIEQVMNTKIFIQVVEHEKDLRDKLFSIYYEQKIKENENNSTWIPMGA